MDTKMGKIRGNRNGLRQLQVLDLQTHHKYYPVWESSTNDEAKEAKARNSFIDQRYEYWAYRGIATSEFRPI
jgi:hypothetical protein